jgi:septal ring factor EnvC (AmiA/AmiB activator)
MPASPIRGTLLALAIVLASGGVSFAQSPSDAEKKLQRVRGELKTVARERRKLEGERGDASRKLRAADEQVGQSSRTLSETEAALQREAAALAELQERRQGMQLGLGEQRRELAELVRNAYMLGSDAPLKVLLSQDRAADAQRALVYHRYLQGDRARRIGTLTTELQALETLERDIEERRKQLAQTREQHRQRIAQLERDRKQRAVVVAELDKRFQNRSSREKALGQDAKSLERLLANLRATARRAEAERRAASRRAAAENASAARSRPRSDPSTGTTTAAPAKPPTRTVVASAAAPKVGGLGWPLSGNLLARFGGKLPDGRASGGVLIGAAAGSTVSAVADGSVVFAEWMTGYGLILIVDHGNGYMSLYAHNDSLLRDAGDVVKRGDALAKVGSSGGQGVPALYFELRRNGQPVDPTTWLQRR